MISVILKGAKEADKVFKVVNNRLKKKKEANAKAVLVIDRWIQQNFQKQGKPVGGWKPLSPATLKAKKKKGKSKILINKGQLKTRWKHKFTDKLALVESGVNYAVYHDQGTKHLPQRQIAPDAKHIDDKVKKIFKNFTEKVIKEENK